MTHLNEEQIQKLGDLTGAKVTHILTLQVELPHELIEKLKQAKAEMSKAIEHLEKVKKLLGDD